MAVEALVFEQSSAPRSGLRVLDEPVTALRLPRVEIGPIAIDQVDLGEAVERLRGFLRSGIPHHVVTANLDFLSLVSRHAAFLDAINRADLVVADGMPLVWLSKLKGQPLAQRITGHDLLHEGCRLAAELSQSVFLLGAAPGVAEAAARALHERHQGLRVAGVYSPPFGVCGADEDDRTVQMVRDAAPGLLLVALGSPRQEIWIRAHLDRLGVPVVIGVGCAFDLLAGTVRRAPTWMQQTGLEWIYRLAQEPSRLWRRYLIDDLPTLGRLVLSSTRGDHSSTTIGPRSSAETPA